MADTDAAYHDQDCFSVKRLSCSAQYDVGSRLHVVERDGSTEMVHEYPREAQTGLLAL